MPTRASKRKASVPAAKVAAAKPAAKRSKGTTAAAAAAGPARKAASGGKATAAAAPSGPPLYAVGCERDSELTNWDDETFVDCYGDEDEGPRDEVEGCTTAGDGVWFHNAAHRQWQHPAVEGSGHRLVNTSQSGQLVVFDSLEAANERAAAVFHDMLTYLPEWLRRALAPAPGSGRKRGGRAAARWDDEEEEEEEEEEDSEEEVEDEASSSSDGEAGARGSRAAQELEPYRTVLRDGRVKYERLAHFYCDPWQLVKPLENRVQSCMTVEVVPVRRGG